MEDLGSPPMSAAQTCFTRAILELLAGAPARAEHAARAGLEAFEAMGNRNQGSTAAALLGLALIEQGHDKDALEFADLAAAWAAPDDSRLTGRSARRPSASARPPRAPRSRPGGGDRRRCAIQGVRRPIATRRCARGPGPRVRAERDAPRTLPSRSTKPLHSTNARATPSRPPAPARR